MSVELDSVSRINSLISAANSKTGNTDTDLTTAVQTLCDGFGSGGDPIAKAICERTITEIHDDTIISVGSYVFQDCKSLTTVDLPNLQTIYDAAFRNCSSLPSMVFPSLTAYNGQGNGVFFGCSKLTTVDFHLAQRFPVYSFYRATALTALILRSATMCTLGATGEQTMGTHISNGTGFIYVPAVLIDSYKEATNWSVYADQFRALEDYTVDGTTTGELDSTKI